MNIVTHCLINTIEVPTMTTILEQIITEKDRQKLKELRNLLEEIIETIDIILDKEAIRKIREAEQDIKQGRTKTWNQFIKELKTSS